MNQIFLLNELLAVSPEIKPKSSTNSESGMKLVVIDDVLKDYQKAYNTISNTPVADWKNGDGGKNFIDYKEGRLQYPVRNRNVLLEVAYHAIKHYYNVETDFQFGSIDVNVWKQITPRTNDFNIVHTDQSCNSKQSYSCLFFMNQPEECSGGTAFFQHLPSKRYAGNVEELGNLLKDNRELWHNGINYWNQDTDGKVWRMTEHAEMVSNRLIIFPSDYFHTAYHPKDSFHDFSRLTLVFWMAEV